MSLSYNINSEYFDSLFLMVIFPNFPFSVQVSPCCTFSTPRYASALPMFSLHMFKSLSNKDLFLGLISRDSVEQDSQEDVRYKVCAPRAQVRQVWRLCQRQKLPHLVCFHTGSNSWQAQNQDQDCILQVNVPQDG